MSAHLHPKAITGFKISWWQWNIWKAYKVFTHARHRGCERYLPCCFLCFHNWEEKTNCGSCSQTSRLPPNSCFQETPSTKSIIIFALEEEKKSVRLLNRNLISNWLLLGCPPQVTEHDTIFHRHCFPWHTQNQQERDGAKNFLWRLALHHLRAGATWGKQSNTEEKETHLFWVILPELFLYVYIFLDSRNHPLRPFVNLIYCI